MKNLSKILFIILIIFSCNGQKNNDKKNVTEKNIISKLSNKINFFDKKYFNGYSLIIDESNILDHPQFNYLNCKKEGYFSIHFIPKNLDLINYWKKKHYENIDLNTINLEKDKIRINQKLSNNFENYNVFAYHVKSEFLDSDEICSEESTFCKKNCLADIYFFNQDIKNWELLKTLKSDILPQLHDNNFFIKSFDNLFSINNLENNNYELPKGFYILNSVELHLKSNDYKILALEKNEIKNKNNTQHNSNEIIILKKNNNQFYKIFVNKKIVFSFDDNCPADGFGGIVSKNNYFTVQQIFCEDFLFVKSFTTFLIDENIGIIKLHKYGEEFTDRSNPDKVIPNLIWTKKDFGEMNFEDVTENFLSGLRQNKPKK